MIEKFKIKHFLRYLFHFIQNLPIRYISIFLENTLKNIGNITLNSPISLICMVKEITYSNIFTFRDTTSQYS